MSSNEVKILAIESSCDETAAAIVSMSDVVEALYNNPYNGKVYIDDELKAAIDKYYAEYGAAK